MEFTNDMFIQEMNSNRTIIYRKIKNLTGQSLSEFILTIRLKTAAQYFIDGNENVAEVCYHVGFKHQSTFTKHFSEMFGKPPREFMKDMKSKK